VTRAWTRVDRLVFAPRSHEVFVAWTTRCAAPAARVERELGRQCCGGR
jgi:hypothetical protein